MSKNSSKKSRIITTEYSLSDVVRGRSRKARTREEIRTWMKDRKFGLLLHKDQLQPTVTMPFDPIAEIEKALRPDGGGQYPRIKVMSGALPQIEESTADSSTNSGEKNGSYAPEDDEDYVQSDSETDEDENEEYEVEDIIDFLHAANADENEDNKGDVNIT